MAERTRFAGVKEIYGFLAGLKRQHPNYEDWDKDDDGCLFDVNLDGIFDGSRIDLCDKAAFLENDAGEVLSFAIINVASKMPAIIRSTRPVTFDGKATAKRSSRIVCDLL
jgi:hypothetical protein